MCAAASNRNDAGVRACDKSHSEYGSPDSVKYLRWRRRADASDTRDYCAYVVAAAAAGEQ